jgi:addiction module RelE/StbE family toxin
MRLLEQDPMAGKTLERELVGFRSYPIPPYRIIYRVEPSSRVVRIIRIGHRNDVYEILVQKINAGEVREKRAIYVHR